jgi:hypothetical protein
MSEARDLNNIKFIQETLAESGTAGLRAWYNKQEVYIQEYVVNLLQMYSVEILDLSQNLSGSVQEATDILNKFRLNTSQI